jgi:protein involved in polysaccharide export with SLBB domain
MTGKLSLFLLMSCTLCAGQCTKTSPSNSSQSSPTAAGEDTLTSCFPAFSGEGDNNSSQSSPSLSGEEEGTSTQLSPTEFGAAKGRVAGKPRNSLKSWTKTEDEADTEDAPESTRKVGPLTARSDFERFAEDATGRRLVVYGRRLFDEVPSTFAPMNNIPVPADYAIGPGDELLIRVWGKINLDTTVTVDRNGQISLPKVGTLNVAGLRYEQLNSYLHTAVGIIYKGFELNVTLGHLHSIQIYVLGSARQPGAYTVSSLSTLLDALFASGGPSATGSMRHIQLRRGDHPLTELDLYDVLRKGDKSHDVQLLPGDVIYIPTVGPQVAIVGNVNEPGIFELKGDTNVFAALEDAGGLTNLATTERVLLERIENSQKRRVDEFALDAAGLRHMLKDGDLLKISPLSPRFENAVMIRGNVASPGRFLWHEGMRVADLIPSREVLVTRDHWNQQNHRADERHTDMMTDIAETNAEINWDYAAIERLDEHDLSTRLIPFNLGNAIDNPAASDNQLLKAGDIITVFSRKDLPLPLEKHATFVQIGGEVNAPGVYRVKPGETLRGVVGRAGGLTSHSYLFAAQLTRMTTKRMQQEQIDLSINRLKKELTSQYANAPRSSTASTAASANAAENQTKLGMQSSLISQLSSVQASGRVVLGIKPDAKTVEDIPNFPLEDGDSFFIPPQLGTVQVIGEVYNANAFRYQTNKCLRAYLDDTGGATRLADTKRIFLIRADGTVVSRQAHNSWSGDFEDMALMPGDAIIVPPKLKVPGGFMEELPMITQVLSQTAMAGAVFSLIN